MAVRFTMLYILYVATCVCVCYGQGALPAEPFILYSNRTNLRSLDLISFAQTNVFGGQNFIVPLGVDTVYQHIYFGDYNLSRISRSNYDGSNLSVIIEGIERVEGLAVDWINRLMYWTSYTSATIEVATLDGQNRTVLINTGLQYPRGMAVDPIAGYFFWSDWGSAAAIERSSLDGSNRVKLVMNNTKWPGGVSLDTRQRLVYWIDGYHDVISCTDYDGRNRRLIFEYNSLSVQSKHVFGFDLDISGDYVYFSAWDTNAIYEVSIRSGILERNISVPTIRSNRGVMGLRVIHRAKQPAGSSNCGNDNGGCEQLCFHKAPSGASCGCRWGMKLAINGKACEDVVPKENIRLQGPSSSGGTGRVEVFYNGTWGTICDDGWDINDARVACRQLGYQDAVRALPGGQVVNGTGQIWLDDVACAGSEKSLAFCFHRGWGNHNCGHGDDAGVECSLSDINECENGSLCPSGHKCVNTLGSYRCEREMPGFKTYRLELRLKEDFTNELSSNTSREFRNFKERMETAMRKVHENNNAYRDVQILKLRSGSIIADLLLRFSEENTEGLSELFEAIRNNSFGDFPVDPDALTVIVIGTCPSDECPGNSTCQQLTAETISCPCNEGYYYDGVNCIEFTVIKVEVSLEKVFTNDLKNSSSEAYKTLARNITAELYEKFKDTPNFQDVRVLGFRNGSTIVEFVVIYRKEEMTKVIVGENVRQKIIGGNLSGYRVIRGFVKGPPPAPDELKHTDVTDNRIEITWKRPKAHLAFVIDGYAIGHRTRAETEYKMETFNSNTTNSVLSNLESDTIYSITIHAYNDEGNGENLEIIVTTEESSSSPVVIIIVVVIVVVLLLIIGMVVVFKLRKRRYRLEAREQAHAQKQMPTTMRLAAIPSTHYDNYGQRDEEGRRSQKL